MVKYLTPKGLEELKKELNYLKQVKRKEIAERLKQAIAFGDLSENFAYHEAKETQGFLEGRILELERTIRNAKIIERQKQTAQVQVGSTVLLIDVNNEKQEFQITGPEEAAPLEGKISFESPLGKALLNKSIGDKIKIEIPEEQKEIIYKILKIK